MTVYQKSRLVNLLYKTQDGDREAEELILRIYPLIMKYSRRMGYDLQEASQDLTEWVIKTIFRYESKKPIS
jgi:predicted membrane-bound mannosyltransferase